MSPRRTSAAHNGRAALLPVSFFRRDSATVARELLGCLVVSFVDGERTVGRIVETEAYEGAGDPASHAYAGRLHAQNAAVYSAPGSWYVYRSYGIHWCANLCCRAPARGSAVLLRALEPVEGLEAMARRRGRALPRELCAGPGKLTMALGMTNALDGVFMPSSAVVVQRGTAVEDARVAIGPRIGITKAADWPLRFAVRGARWLSRPAE